MEDMGAFSFCGAYSFVLKLELGLSFSLPEIDLILLSKLSLVFDVPKVSVL